MTSREWQYVSQFDVKYNDPDFDRTFASALSVPSRLNRYSDVLANEKTLFPTPTSPIVPRNTFPDLHASNDAKSLNIAFPYLNANLFMPSHFGHCPHAIVACQSPQPEQLYAFWQTVLVYQVPLIIMLTRLYEVKKDRVYMKAEPYWPEPNNPIVNKSSGITVEVVDEKNDENNQTIYRTILVKKGSISHTVEHVHFCGWADYSVPDNDGAFMKMVAKMEHAESTKGPIIVHCSAGIGRTGTLMGVYYGRHLLRKAAEEEEEEFEGKKRKFEKPSDVRSAMIDIVCQMKKTRSGMVQKQEQLQYMLKCLGV